MKFKPHPKHGTDEDIRRILLLNYPGCKSIGEALEKQRLEQPKPSPPQDSSLPPSIDEVFRSAVREIALHLDDYDIDFLDAQKRFDLAKMPLSTIEEINRWKREWLNVGVKK